MGKRRKVPTIDHSSEDRALSERLGYVFTDPVLLALALTHRSVLGQQGFAQSNERLEFLGDSVLGFVVSDALFRRRSDHSEGRLTRARSTLVNEATLTDLARTLELGRALRLSKGADLQGERNNGAVLADAMEAVLGAVYLDGGIIEARRVVMDLLSDVFDERLGAFDPKSRLQELAARLVVDLGERDGTDGADFMPDYTTVMSGLEHRREFSTTVKVLGQQFGPCTGTSKQQSEQAVAETALRTLESPERTL